MCLTFLSSLKVFRLDSRHYKVISIILGIDCIIELTCFVLMEFHVTNTPLYNFNLLAEFWGYTYYYSLIILHKGLQKIIRAFLWLLPLIWTVLVLMVFGPKTWNSYFFVTGCIAMVLFSAAYYHQMFTAAKLIRLTTSFEFWVATALIVYYACMLPYLGMLNFLATNFQPLANKLLVGLQVLNIIFYLILLYAFICTIHIGKSS